MDAGKGLVESYGVEPERVWRALRVGVTDAEMLRTSPWFLL